ncbi:MULTISPECIES: hypothetical protein [Desulfitobacterium]|uniref:Uncharacterized protein n=1 Tax=Desulfitobacterium chlororespirans DSM 11544 TaxID=1121395 RepID=A0A1M7UU38_9FIRM|nr:MULTISPECIES: hypothetical protein [Desulfitobacterium]SHN86455.1 hypothetical protein SAMN02745215_04633 [Desulfitobacterium chlororespirans DSM 11544]
MSNQANQTIVQSIKNIQAAIIIANEIERYESALKTMKDLLKEFVEKTGLPVDTGEKVWDFSVSTSWDFTGDKLKDLSAEILMMGYNPWEYLKLGSKEIEKLNLSEAILKKYGASKTSKRFTSKKSGSGSVKIKKTA